MCTLIPRSVKASTDSKTTDSVTIMASPMVKHCGRYRKTADSRAKYKRKHTVTCMKSVSAKLWSRPK